MNCETVQKRIDEKAYTEGWKPDGEILSHISGCDRCGEYLDETVSAAGLIDMLRKTDPKPHDPAALTDSIISKVGKITIERQVAGFSFFTRVLSAIAAVLFIIFITEQTIVLDKIHRLERKMTLIQGKADRPLPSIQLASLLDAAKAFQSGERKIRFEDLMLLLRLKNNAPIFTFYKNQRFLNKKGAVSSAPDPNPEK